VPESLPARAWRVRPVGTGDWLDARLVYACTTADVAVLELAAPAGVGPPGTLRWGRLAGADPVAARAVGFPEALRTRTSPRGLPVRDPEDVRGELRPTTAVKGDEMSLHLWGSTPGWQSDGSPWARMSGAAVWCGPWLVGVVAVDPANFAGDRLGVAMLDAAEDRQLWSALAVGAGAVERADRPVCLLDPYRAPPRRVRESVRLPHAGYGLVPFAAATASSTSSSRGVRAPRTRRCCW
jgi:hypothetical protein